MHLKREVLPFSTSVTFWAEVALAGGLRQAFIGGEERAVLPQAHAGLEGIERPERTGGAFAHEHAFGLEERPAAAFQLGGFFAVGFGGDGQREGFGAAGADHEGAEGADEAGERQAHVRVIRRGREGDAGLLEVSGGGGAQAVGRGVSALADRAQMAAAEHAHRTGGRVVQACARFRGKGAAERIQLTGINRPKNHCLHSFPIFEIVKAFLDGVETATMPRGIGAGPSPLAILRGFPVPRRRLGACAFSFVRRRAIRKLSLY